MEEEKKLNEQNPEGQNGSQNPTGEGQKGGTEPSNLTLEGLKAQNDELKSRLDVLSTTLASLTVSVEALKPAQESGQNKGAARTEKEVAESLVRWLS